MVRIDWGEKSLSRKISSGGIAIEVLVAIIKGASDPSDEAKCNKSRIVGLISIKETTLGILAF